MARKFLATLLFVFICTALPSSAFTLDEQQFLTKARAYLDEGSYLEAIGVYRALQELSAQAEIKALALLNIANIYGQQLKDYGRAIEEYATLIKKYEKSRYAAQAMFSSGMILHEMGRSKDAQEFFSLYLKKYPAGEAREVAAFMVDASGLAERIDDSQRFFVGPARDEAIRVLLERGLERVTITARNTLTVFDRQGMSLASGLPLVSIELRGGVLYLDGQALETNQVVVMGGNRTLLQHGSRSYRGRLIAKTASGGLELINELPLEAYLYGVVPREMPSRWPMEALKAQAVAARTYAFYLKQRTNSLDYHLCATTMSQAYNGAAFETDNTNRAVDETRGQLLYYRGVPALAYFHAHSGGITEDPRHVWSAPVPYLRPVVDSFSMMAPSSSWSVTLDYETIRRSLGRAGIELGAIAEIVPLEFSPSNRLVRVKIVHQGGETTLGGNEFRLILGPTLIRSTLLALTNNGGSVTFEGRGYGHGVGMSQWGAMAMAREGYNWREILKYYYPELELR